MERRVSRRAIIGTGLVGVAIYIAHRALNETQTATTEAPIVTDPAGSARVETRDGSESVFINPNQSVVLKASFEEDLHAVITNIGKPDKPTGSLVISDPNDPKSKLIDTSNFPRAKVMFEGESPRPDKDSLKYSFAGIKWHAHLNGMVEVYYPTPQPDVPLGHTWTLVKIRG